MNRKISIRCAKEIAAEPKRLLPELAETLRSTAVESDEERWSLTERVGGRAHTVTLHSARGAGAHELVVSASSYVGDEYVEVGAFLVSGIAALGLVVWLMGILAPRLPPWLMFSVLTVIFLTVCGVGGILLNRGARAALTASFDARHRTEDEAFASKVVAELQQNKAVEITTTPCG